MKAMIHEKYGPAEVIRLAEVEKPAPHEGEVLVRVRAASLNAYDWHMLSADIFLIRLMVGGLLRPKNTRLGADVAGEVEALGRGAEQFKPGEAVFGDLASFGGGSLAEYVAVPERAFARKPANLSFEEAAAVPMAAVTALQALRDQGRISTGQKVLIHGASGGVGTFAVQLAKYFGAEVTAVCSARNAEQARALGADYVIDYAREDFTRSGRQYDLILAVNGYHSLAAYRRALAPGGSYVMAGGKPGQIFQAVLLGKAMSGREGRQMGAVSAKLNPADLTFLRDLLEAGKIKPVIDRCYPFDQTAEAFRYLGAGHARGKIVVTL